MVRHREGKKSVVLLADRRPPEAYVYIYRLGGGVKRGREPKGFVLDALADGVLLQIISWSFINIPVWPTCPSYAVWSWQAGDSRRVSTRTLLDPFAILATYMQLLAGLGYGLI